ncbi:MAG: ketoacyl-ACP synthase III [Pseudomonadota bacterium]
MIDIYLNYIGSAYGSKTERNDPASLGQSIEDCERIVLKTGVRSRPVVAEDEYTSDLALRAVRQLLQRGNIDDAAIDNLIVCTQTPDHLIPGVSSRLHGELGLSKDCFTLDINQGCSGFIYGAHLVSSMIRARASHESILVNADCYSRLIRPADLTTRILFGDAAAASYFSSRPRGLRLLYSRCYADGLGYNDFVARGSAIQPDVESESGIYMDGPAILGFALRVVPEAIAAALAETGTSLEKIRMVIFHQANSFVIGKLAYKLQLRPEQVPQNCAELGNTVSASIPLLLLEQMPLLESGDLVIAVGFGVGLSWGAMVLERASDFDESSAHHQHV